MVRLKCLALVLLLCVSELCSFTPAAVASETPEDFSSRIMQLEQRLVKLEQINDQLMTRTDELLHIIDTIIDPSLLLQWPPAKGPRTPEILSRLRNRQLVPQNGLQVTLQARMMNIEVECEIYEYGLESLEEFRARVEQQKLVPPAGYTLLGQAVQFNELCDMLVAGEMTPEHAARLLQILRRGR